MDPLPLLPAEIVLRILEHITTRCVTRLSRVSKDWHQFIDEYNQDAIYSYRSEANKRPGALDFSCLWEAHSFTGYYAEATTWKDVCRRERMLERAMRRPSFEAKGYIVLVRNVSVWRFRADFKRRIFLATAEEGGLYVVDMNNGSMLWSLDKEKARGYAHLEYYDGTAVWDNSSNGLEVWRMDDTCAEKGRMQPVTVLTPTMTTKGFQLYRNSLCVVGEDGGIIFDLSRDPPLEALHFRTPHPVIGHLDQDSNVVVISMGLQGYFFLDKRSGSSLGILQPRTCQRVYNIVHTHTASRYGDIAAAQADDYAASKAFVLRTPSEEQFSSLHIQPGPRNGSGTRDETDEEDEEVPITADEWGAGNLDGNIMIGISQAGRVFICSDWRSALMSEDSLNDNSSLVECAYEETDPAPAVQQRGSWLSVRQNRAMFQVLDKVYLLNLTDEGTIPQPPSSPNIPSWCFLLFTHRLGVLPASFLGTYEDCVMTTYDVMSIRSVTGQGLPPDHTLPLPTRVIRVLSFPPEIKHNNQDDKANASTTEETLTRPP